MGIALKKSSQSKLLKLLLGTALLLVSATALVPIVTFNSQNASAAEAWETEGWKRVSTGRAHTCAIASDDKAYCWGENNSGQLGNNSTTYSLVPVAVDTTGVLAGKTIISTSLSSYYTCALASDNQAYCWGDNSNGQLGNGSVNSTGAPTQVTATYVEPTVSYIFARYSTG